jgi:hypothetical protein
VSPARQLRLVDAPDVGFTIDDRVIVVFPIDGGLAALNDPVRSTDELGLSTVDATNQAVRRRLSGGVHPRLRAD